MCSRDETLTSYNFYSNEVKELNLYRIFCKPSNKQINVRIYRIIFTILYLNIVFDYMTDITLFLNSTTTLI